LKKYRVPCRIRKNNHFLKTIYIPIEIKYRELNSQILLATQLVAKDARVYIGSKSKIYSLLECKKEKGGIFLYKGTKSSNFFNYIKTRCNFISILDQELSPVRDPEKDTVSNRLTPNSIEHISQYFVVNNIIKDNIITYHPDLALKTIVTGWPRVDIWSKYSKNIYKREIKQIKKSYGEYVLFSSDFGRISRKSIEGTIRQAKDSGVPVRVKNVEKLRSKLEASNKEFLEIVTWLKECDNDPEVPLIVVRPHPSDDHLEWEKALHKLKKVKVIYKYDVTPWILQSKAVLHRGCTSALEAIIHEKPSIFIETKSNINKDSTAYKISERISERRSLVSLLQKLENIRFEPTLHQKNILSRQIYMEENMLASEKIAKSLLSLDVTSEKAMKKTFFMLWRVLKKFENLFNKSSLSISHDKVKKYSLASNAQKIPNGISKREITTKIKAISKDKITIRKVANNLYCISK